MQIKFEVIPHKKQRYDTAGDYWVDAKGVMQFRVSDLSNNDYEFPIFIHELIEWYLVRRRGISEEAISKFDKEFERLRSKNKKLIGTQEPGHMVSAPYHDEHVFAEKIERLLIEELGLSWEKYDQEVDNL